MAKLLMEGWWYDVAPNMQAMSKLCKLGQNDSLSRTSHFACCKGTRENTMGNRLTQIATRTGDEGTTGLGNNQRVSKNSLRVHAMGDVDELNSHIGLLLCEPIQEELRQLLVEIQHQLFNLGGELSIPGFELLKTEAVVVLDDALEKYNAMLPKLEEFILPAGNRAASQAHVCRTVARRAERATVALGNEEALNDAPRQYLNRLSDLMFVLSRVFNRMDGGSDVYWQSERMKK
jgi:cob(I)alamin adenosyltransferase